MAKQLSISLEKFPVVTGQTQESLEFPKVSWHRLAQHDLDLSLICGHPFFGNDVAQVLLSWLPEATFLGICVQAVFGELCQYHLEAQDMLFSGAVVHQYVIEKY